MNLAAYVDTLNVLGDESRIRLCALLREHELCVSELVRLTGIAQSRVSTHLARLKEAGVVRDRRVGVQTFYALAKDALTPTAKAILEEAFQSSDPTLEGDQARLKKYQDELEDKPDRFAGEMERHYSPGRTWQSLAAGLAAFLRLGRVLDVGSGDGAAAACFAPYCEQLRCIDINPRMVAAANERFGAKVHINAQVADAHELPFPPSYFDAILVFHTLTYVESPKRVLAECARVLRPGGRLVVLSLDQHKHQDITAPHGERHPGFSPRSLKSMLSRTGLEVVRSEVASREAKKPHFQVVLAIAEQSGSPHAAADQASPTGEKQKA
jgi:ArsR family transcriptional regulator